MSKAISDSAVLSIMLCSNYHYYCCYHFIESLCFGIRMTVTIWNKQESTAPSCLLPAVYAAAAAGGAGVGLTLPHFEFLCIKWASCKCTMCRLTELGSFRTGSASRTAIRWMRWSRRLAFWMCSWTNPPQLADAIKTKQTKMFAERFLCLVDFKPWGTVAVARAGKCPTQHWQWLLDDVAGETATKERITPPRAEHNHCRRKTNGRNFEKTPSKIDE